MAPSRKLPPATSAQTKTSTAIGRSRLQEALLEHTAPLLITRRRTWMRGRRPARSPWQHGAARGQLQPSAELPPPIRPASPAKAGLVILSSAIPSRFKFFGLL